MELLKEILFCDSHFLVVLEFSHYQITEVHLDTMMD